MPVGVEMDRILYRRSGRRRRGRGAPHPRLRRPLRSVRRACATSRPSPRTPPRPARSHGSEAGKRVAPAARRLRARIRQTARPSPVTRMPRPRRRRRGGTGQRGHSSPDTRSRGRAACASGNRARGRSARSGRRSRGARASPCARSIPPRSRDTGRPAGLEGRLANGPRVGTARLRRADSPTCWSRRNRGSRARPRIGEVSPLVEHLRSPSQPGRRRPARVLCGCEST